MEKIMALAYRFYILDRGYWLLNEEKIYNTIDNPFLKPRRGNYETL